ncbi:MULTISPECIES: hypothetical protein [Paraburkholderia]|uniref:Uncharacterized protein n=2 Tax=Paraburkholderia TaxID=1822464 RepID=A0A6J5FJV8_9BURK|nr:MULTISPECIES: hypothetical protein [Paraburkholderia]GGC65435.1 hypothetical protein GCM10011400_61810 [Paraburkholderia caffeinilytica]CAB3781803.1 hypothetical protein LMG28688_01330 [Paraburkholderia caffeinitolerans]CAB3802269.1 hypothetical protein LMG28690_05533 [Paraburkholderia caffeinilytica]
MDENLEEHDEGSRYDDPDAIGSTALYQSLSNLVFFSDDMYLSSQAQNLNLVDQFLMPLEYKVLRELFETDSTPADTHFLLAQSQMWIFAAYELLRNWRQRASEIIKWHANHGLEQKLASLKERHKADLHFGLRIRIEQIERVLNDEAIVAELDRQRRHIYIPFARLEWVRVSLAKHEVSGNPKQAALMPGYGRINSWCGSLDFELENGKYSMGYINRRDIADSIRDLDFTAEPPDDETIESFDAFMSGKGFEPD